MSDDPIYDLPEAPRTAAATAPRHARVVIGVPPQNWLAHWLKGYKTIVIPEGYEVCGKDEEGARFAGRLVYDGRGVEYDLGRRGRTHSYRNFYIRRVAHKTNEQSAAKSAEND